MKNRFWAPVTFLGLIAVAPCAFAQDRALTIQPYAVSPYDDGFNHEDFGVAVDALPTPFSHGGSCVKMCKFDMTPCDPDYWKVADRRCNYNQRG